MKITMEFYAELDDQVPDADDETLRALWPVFVKEQEQVDLFREFLDEVSRICGEHDAPSTSMSTTRGSGRSYTAATRRERILDVSTLGALPASRAVVMPSGTYPLVVRKVAWHDNKAHREAAA